MRRGFKNQFEIARFWNDRAEAVRKIADRLTHDAYRNLLWTVAEEFEGRAKEVAYRARRAITRDPGALVEKSQDCKRAPREKAIRASSRRRRAKSRLVR